MSRRLIFVLVTMLCMVSCHSFVEFKGPYFVYFDPKGSSSTSINELGELVGSYTVHYSGVKRSDKLQVNYEINVGDGLTEGLDYDFESVKGVVTFFPGVYDMTIRIRFLKHEIDPLKENRITLTLSSVSDPDVSAGFPGPDGNGRILIINKYKNE